MIPYEWTGGRKHLRGRSTVWYGGVLSGTVGYSRCGRAEAPARTVQYCVVWWALWGTQGAGGRKAYADSGGRVGAGLVQGHCSQLQALGCAFGGVCQAGAFNRLCKAHTHAGMHACVAQDASVKEHWPNIVSLIIEHAAPLHKQVAPIIESDARCAAAAHTSTNRTAGKRLSAHTRTTWRHAGWAMTAWKMGHPWPV